NGLPAPAAPVVRPVPPARPAACARIVPAAEPVGSAGRATARPVGPLGAGFPRLRRAPGLRAFFPRVPRLHAPVLHAPVLRAPGPRALGRRDRDRCPAAAALLRASRRPSLVVVLVAPAVGARPGGCVDRPVRAAPGPLSQRTAGR